MHVFPDNCVQDKAISIKKNRFKIRYNCDMFLQIFNAYILKSYKVPKKKAKIIEKTLPIKFKFLL